MSDYFADTRSSVAQRADKAAMALARRDVVERAREYALLTPYLPANDRDPEAA